jgi:MoxR-like ATPase
MDTKGGSKFMSMLISGQPATADVIKEALQKEGYIPTTQIIYTLMVAMRTGMPILVEGDPGVGKTSLAQAVARGFEKELIRIQFYEGITSNDILYEYDYPRQLLMMNAIKDNIHDEISDLTAQAALDKVSSDIDFYGEDFLIQRPLLRAINGEGQKVLLLDEIDKCSEETENLLLEILSEFSISIPELGKTVKCDEESRPLVILTSNNYRELSDTLKRRCLYLYIPAQTPEEASKIIAAKANVPDKFALRVANEVNEIRKLSLKQKPSISESIVWAASLVSTIGEDAFSPAHKKEIVYSLGVLLKNQGDIDVVKTRYSGVSA